MMFITQLLSIVAVSAGLVSSVALPTEETNSVLAAGFQLDAVSADFALLGNSSTSAARSLLGRTPPGCSTSDKWQGYIYSGANCDSTGFSRCVSSSIGCTPVASALGNLAGRTVYVDAAPTQCDIYIYSNLDCSGSATVIRRGSNTGCWQRNLGESFLGYKITC